MKKRFVIDLALISDTCVLCGNGKFYKTILVNKETQQINNDSVRSIVNFILKNTGENDDIEIIIETIDFTNTEWKIAQGVIENAIASTVGAGRVSFKRVCVSEWQGIIAKKLGFLNLKDWQEKLKYINSEKHIDGETMFLYDIGQSRFYYIPSSYMIKGRRDSKVLAYVYSLKQDGVEADDEDVGDCMAIMNVFDELNGKYIQKQIKTSNARNRRHTAKDTLRSEKNARIGLLVAQISEIKKFCKSISKINKKELKKMNERDYCATLAKYEVGSFILNDILKGKIK